MNLVDSTNRYLSEKMGYAVVVYGTVNFEKEEISFDVIHDKKAETHLNSYGSLNFADISDQLKAVFNHHIEQRIKLDSVFKGEIRRFLHIRKNIEFDASGLYYLIAFLVKDLPVEVKYLPKLLPYHYLAPYVNLTLLCAFSSEEGVAFLEDHKEAYEINLMLFGMMARHITSRRSFSKYELELLDIFLTSTKKEEALAKLKAMKRELDDSLRSVDEEECFFLNRIHQRRW